MGKRLTGARKWILPLVMAIALLTTVKGFTHYTNQEKNLKSSSEGEERIQNALEILAHLPAGRGLLQKALETWNFKAYIELLSIFKWGSTSRTDAVLTRHFNPLSGNEEREREVVIYLKRSQPLKDLVLDMAHELVHATLRPVWDPYDPKLTAGRYVFSAIEGSGGEVEAVMAECQVGLELSNRFGTQIDRCQSYLGKSEKLTVEKDQVKKDFYRAGKWVPELRQKLGSEISLFPLLSSDSPKLYSSTGNAPYPVSLLKEFEDITSVACENSRKRVETLNNRSLASVKLANERNDSERFLAHRCK
jgi:hypothetical protein